MENINEIEQEEINISINSSKKAMNGELIISCSELSFSERSYKRDGVGIHISVPGKGKTKYDGLCVGQSIEYQEKHFYKVTLLTINKDKHSIDVLVSKQKLPESPELQENIIQESETSRKRIFQELINKHCTNLSASKYKYYEHYLDVKERGFFKSTIFTVIGKNTREFDVYHNYRIKPTLFRYEWDNICIKVYSSLYFDDLTKVAREYSQLTGKKAFVEKCF